MKLITPSPERLRDILAAADRLLSRLAYMPSAEGPATAAAVIAYMEAGDAARTVVGLLPKVLHIGDGDDPAAGDFRLAWSGFTDALARLVRHYQWHAPLGPGSHKDIPADRRSDYLAFLLRPGDIGIVQDLRRGADHLRRFTETTDRAGPDFRSVRWRGSDYVFTAAQAHIVRMLWEAWIAGTPDVGDETATAAAGTERKMKEVFRGSAAWGVMIVEGATKGTHRIAGDPPPEI
jgi:hypothetical protein